MSPEDIIAFTEALQTALTNINDAVAAVVAIPGQALENVLLAAADLNAQLFDQLIAATSNPTLNALLVIMRNTSTAGLAALAGTVGAANEVITTTITDAGALISSALTSSLQRTLLAILDVVNNPLSSSAYAELLNSGIGAGQSFLTAGIGTVQVLGNSGFDLALIGLGGLGTQFAIATTGLESLLALASDTANSTIVDGVIALVQGFVLTPVEFGVGVGITTAIDVLTFAQEGFNIAFDGVTELVNIAGSSLQSAIAQIGQNPLDPANYAVALSALVQGGFLGFNSVVNTTTALAQVPLNLATSLTTTFADAFKLLNLTVASSVSQVLTAVGLPSNIADLPVQFANSVNAAVTAVADGINNGIGAVGDLVTGAGQLALNVSGTLEDAIFQILPPPPPLVPLNANLVTTSSTPELTFARAGAAGGEEGAGNGEVTGAGEDAGAGAGT
ncbi:MAG: hypothetical protein WBB07_16320, partial [Mycobacterium sp.]